MFREIVDLLLDHLGPKITGEEAEVIATELLDQLRSEFERSLDWIFDD